MTRLTPSSPAESELGGAVRGMDGRIGRVEEEASAASRCQDFCAAPPPDPAMAGVDRISLLPDDIINHILSFISTTNLRARTSLLSRRWRHIWTHHPSIHLSFPLPLPSGADKDAAARAYVMAVLSCLQSCKALVLHLFSIDLCLPSSCTPAEAKIYADVSDLWLRFAGLRAVRELRVCAKDPRSAYDEHPTIPGTLFCCDLVADLTVTDSTFPNVPPDFLGFRFLKSLHLSHGSIDNDTMADLLDCCPVLESLRVVGCSVLTEVEVPPWILPRLTHLDMFNCEDLLVASIQAPNLRSITYEGDLQCLYLTASPVEAALRHFTEAGDIDTQDDLMSLLLSISTVSVLTANTWFYQFAFTKPTVLNNLKELYLYIDYELTESKAKALVTNIGECPMLEKLDINLSYVLQDSLVVDDSWPNLKYSDSLLKHLEEINEREWSNPPEFVGVPRCTLCYLKTVIIREFVGSKNEMCLANFLLQNAVALEKFVVFDFIECDDDQLEELLAPIPRASSQVQLELFPVKNSTQDYGLQKHSWIFRY